MKKFFLFALIAIVMCACSDNMMLNEPVENTVLSRSNEQTTVSDDYTVTPEMVCKYLNLARKGKTIDSITPVIEDGDTLAYVAQYTENKGWDLISGDKRVAPVLASANSGILNLNDTINPAVNTIYDMISLCKENSETIKHSIWFALEEKPRTSYNSSPQPRGNGTGKWIITDTIYEEEFYLKSHLITTKWHQDAPWNELCPMFNQTYSKAGCAPIATSQVIYYFRENNNRNIQIPSNANCSPYDGSVIFTDYSLTPWTKIVKNEADTANRQYTQAFISYIGYLLETDYGATESSVVSEKEIDVLANFRLSGTRVYSYNYNQIMYSLNRNSPVIISCKNTQNDFHLFIIDSYQTSTVNMYIQYTWDPTAELEDWEGPYGEPAETDKDGYARRTELIGNSTNTYISMNWGYNNTSDTYYNAYSYQSAVNYGDYSIPESTTIYTPNWTVRTNGSTKRYNSFNYMIYNISEMQ